MRAPHLHLPKHLRLPLALGSLYMVLGGMVLHKYLHWDSQWLLALALVPLVAQVQPGKRLPMAPLLLAAGLALLAGYLQNYTVFFFAFLLAAWCGAQLVLGRLAGYPLLLLAVASPIFKYIADIISFPLRLQLTGWAVAVLQALGTSAEAAGNLIMVQGEEFSVDPACAGLSMLSLSLLLAVFVLAHLQRTAQQRWPWWAAGLLLGTMLLLNLGANLLRILLLVLFRVLPGHPLHDAIGLLCLLCYALLPYYFLARQLHRRVGQPAVSPAAAGRQVCFRRALLLNSLLLVLLAGAGFHTLSKKPPSAFAQQAPQLAGFVQEQAENGVTKYSRAGALVYIKPAPAFYSTEHHPLICWEGSGYRFRQVQQRQVGGYAVYIGELRKGKDTLYTAWWMANGQHHTIDQWDWRWRMLQGEPKFSLVNVTVALPAALPQAVQEVMQQVSSGSLAQR